MRKITVVGLLVLGLMVLSSVVVKAVECGWCGGQCGDLATMGVCTGKTMPLEGKVCAEDAGVCAIKVVTPTPTTVYGCHGVPTSCLTAPCPTRIICVDPGPSIMPTTVSDSIMVSTGCSNGGAWDVSITNNVRSMENIWEVVEDMKTGMKTITSYYSGWAIGTSVFNSVNNSGFSGIRRGGEYVEKVPFVADGRVYIVAAFTAPYTSEIPTLTSKLAEARFSMNCLTNLVADANKDGKTDLVDFSIWKRDYLQFANVEPEGNMAGDLNSDGKTDLVDFGLWKKEYLGI